MMSWIQDEFARGAAEEQIEAIGNISAKDALVPHEICLEATWLIATIKMHPYREDEGCHDRFTNAAHQSGYALRRIQRQVPTVRPWERTRICSRIRDHAIQRESWRRNLLAKFCRHHRQRFTGICGIIRERGAAHPARLVLMPYTRDERMLPRLLCFVEYLNLNPA